MVFIHGFLVHFGEWDSYWFLPKFKKVETRRPFVIAMEALSCMLKRVVEGGFLTPCQVRGKGSERVDVSHLLFADNTLIFCKASKDDMTHLGWLLMCFEAIFGLKINLEKNELFLVGSGDDGEDLAFKVGCKVGSLPSTYLWVLLSNQLRLGTE